MKKIIFVLSIVGFLLSYSHQNYSYANDVVYKSSQDDYVQISNLPTIFIDTENGVDITSKEEYVNAVVTVRGAANAEDDITIEATALLGESVSFYEAIDVEYKNLFDESDEDYEYAIKLDAAISHYWEKRDFALFYCVNFLNIPMDDLYVSDSEILTESEILD